MKRRKWKLAHAITTPSVRDVIEELEDAIETNGQSFRELDGVVRDECAIRTITAFRVAVQLIKRAYPGSSRK